MYWGLETGAFRGDVKWAHDYPRAEQNFGRIVEEITALDIVLAPNGGNVLPLDDPMLTRYPIAYMSEPGFWRPSEADLEALGNYLRKGGFIIFDDFTGDHWYNLVRQLDLAIPGLVPIELTAEHPIFHSFFEIDTLEMEPMYGPPPTFWGIFENNDPNGRMMGIINYENDIGGVLGVLRHRLVRRRRDERGVPVRRQLRRVRADALTPRHKRQTGGPIPWSLTSPPRPSRPIWSRPTTLYSPTG